MWWQTSVSRPESRAAGPGRRDREVPYLAAVTPNNDDTPNDVSFEAGPGLNQQPTPTANTASASASWAISSQETPKTFEFQPPTKVTVTIIDLFRWNCCSFCYKSSPSLSVGRSSCSTSEAAWVSDSSGFSISLLGLFNHLARFSVNRKEGDYELSHGPSGVSRWVFLFRNLEFDVFRTHLNLWLCWTSARWCHPYALALRSWAENFGQIKNEAV